MLTVSEIHKAFSDFVVHLKGRFDSVESRVDSLESGAGGSSGAVDSVNGHTGTVVLGAGDVGALPDTYTPPAQAWADITGKPTLVDQADIDTINTDITGTATRTDGTVIEFGPGQPFSVGDVTAAATSLASDAMYMLQNNVAYRSELAEYASDEDLTAGLDGKSDTGHTHPVSPYSWADVADKPSVYPPEDHVHDVSDVAGLTGALADAGTSQTLSLTGEDLTLSDGGGTVTLPTSGSGNTGTAPAPHIAPEAGEWVGGYLPSGYGSTANRVVNSSGSTSSIDTTSANPTPFYIGQAADFDEVGLQVAVAEVDKSAKIALYDRTLALVATSPLISLAATGNVTVSLSQAAHLAAGPYWAVVYSDATTAEIMCSQFQPPNNVQDSFNRLQSLPTDGPKLSAGDFATPAPTAVWNTAHSQWGGNNSPFVGLKRSESGV